MYTLFVSKRGLSLPVSWPYASCYLRIKNILYFGWFETYKKTTFFVLEKVRFETKASDTLGNFIRRSPRSAKIARCARCGDCDSLRSPRSAYKIADILHFRCRRLNSPAFAKCARSRDFLRLMLRIASKVNPSG